MKKYEVRKNVVFAYIVDEYGNRVGDLFPASTNFAFDGCSIIATITDSKKEKKYKVLSYGEDDRQISNFTCTDIEKLENGNYKLTLEKDYNGVENKFIFNPNTGKIASRLYESMSRIDDEQVFLCTRVDNRRGFRIEHRLKVNDNGEVVSDALNTYTEEVVPYDRIEEDVNSTINMILEKKNKVFVMSYGLPINKDKCKVK